MKPTHAVMRQGGMGRATYAVMRLVDVEDQTLAVHTELTDRQWHNCFGAKDRAFAAAAQAAGGRHRVAPALMVEDYLGPRVVKLKPMEPACARQ